MSQAAADAAALVVSTQQSDRDPEAAPPARQLATTVHEAAMMVAQQNVEAAAQVASDVAAAVAIVARDAARAVRRRAIDRGQPGPTALTTEPADAMLTSAPAREPTLYAVAAKNR